MTTPTAHAPLDFIPVPGIRLGVAAAEIRYRGRDDLVVIEMPEGASCAAVFTKNAFCAAPVKVAGEHLASASPRYLIINAGNANAGTGRDGLKAALESCKALAALRECPANQVLPFSTGVIGEHLPVARLAGALPQALNDLGEDRWERAVRAIMTTDTRPKLFSRRVEIAGMPIVVTGMAKGAGMICPNMATMLAFIATDAKVTPELLQECLDDAVEPSFNSISIDGDTSTNDACVLMASGHTGGLIADRKSLEFGLLCDAVRGLCMDLARAIVKDGEGATKLVEIQIDEAASLAEAKQVGYTIAHSPLVKTALFASDPNWGRILAAVGRAGVEELEIEPIRIWLDQVSIVRDGGRDPQYTEAAGKAVLSKPEFQIRVALGRGRSSARILTCDLSHDYVTINAEYRT